MSRAIAPLQVPVSERVPPLNPDRRWQLTDFVFDRTLYTVLFGWGRFFLFMSTCIVLSCQLIDIADDDFAKVLNLKDAELNTKHINNAFNVFIALLCLFDSILTPDDIWNNYQPSHAYSYLTRIPKNIRLGFYMTAISGFSTHKFNMWLSDHNDEIETALYQNFINDHVENALIVSRAFLLVGGALCLLVGLILPDDTIYDEEYWGAWGKRWYEKSSFDATEKRHRVLVPFHNWGLLAINWMLFGFKAVIPAVGIFFHYNELMEHWDDKFVDDFYHNSEVSYTTGQLSMLVFGGALLVDAAFSLLAPFALLQNVNEPQNYRPVHFWVMFMHWYYTTTLTDYKGQDPTDGEDYIALNRVFSLCLLACYIFQEVFVAPATSNSRLNDRRIRNGKPPIRTGLVAQTFISTPLKSILRFFSLIKLDALQNLLQAVAVALGTFSLVLFTIGYVGPWLRLHPQPGTTVSKITNVLEPAFEAAKAVDDVWHSIKNDVIREVTCDFDDEPQNSEEPRGLLADVFHDIQENTQEDGLPTSTEFDATFANGPVSCIDDLKDENGQCLVVFADDTIQENLNGTCAQTDPTFPRCFNESLPFIGISSLAGTRDQSLFVPNDEVDRLNNFARASFPKEKEVQCRDRNCKIILGVTAATLAAKAAAVATSWIPFVSAGSGAAAAVAEAAEITGRVIYETVRFVVRVVQNVRRFLGRLGIFKLARKAWNAFHSVFVPKLVAFESKILYGYLPLYITGFMSFGFGFWRRARLRRADYNDLFNALIAVTIGIFVANVGMTFVMFEGPKRVNQLLRAILPSAIIILEIEEKEGYILLRLASVFAMASSALWLAVMILEKLEDIKEFFERLVFGGKGNRFDQSGYKLQARHMYADTVENVGAAKPLQLTVKEPRYRDNVGAWLQTLFWCLIIVFVAYPDIFPEDDQIRVFSVERDSQRSFMNVIFEMVKGVAMIGDAGAVQGDHNNLCDVIGELVKKGLALLLKSFFTVIGAVIPGLTTLGDQLFGLFKFLSSFTQLLFENAQSILMFIVYTPVIAFFVLLVVGITAYVLRMGNTVSVWIRYLMMSVATYGLTFLLTLQVYADMLNGINIPIINYRLLFSDAVQHSIICCFVIFFSFTHWYFDRVFPLYGALKADGSDYDAFRYKLKAGENTLLENTASIHSLLDEQQPTQAEQTVHLKKTLSVAKTPGPIDSNQRLTLSSKWFT